MNTPEKVRAVFRELRATLGDAEPAGELLQLAAELVGLVDSQENDLRSSLRSGGLPFCQWSLVAAFADGGWRVLRHERDLMREVYDFNDGPESLYHGVDLAFRRAA